MWSNIKATRLLYCFKNTENFKIWVPIPTFLCTYFVPEAFRPASGLQKEKKIFEITKTKLQIIHIDIYIYEHCKHLRFVEKKKHYVYSILLHMRKNLDVDLWENTLISNLLILKTCEKISQWPVFNGWALVNTVPFQRIGDNEVLYQPATGRPSLRIFDKLLRHESLSF